MPTARREVPLRQQEMDRVLGSYVADGMNLDVFMESTRLKASYADDRFTLALKFSGRQRSPTH